MQKTDKLPLAMILIPILDEQHDLPVCLGAVAGLPLLRRVMLMAAKAGFSNLRVVSDIKAEMFEEILADTDVRVSATTAPDLQSYHGSILLLAPNCLPDRDFFMHLVETQLKPDDCLLWEDRQALLLGTKHNSALWTHLAQARCFEDLVNALTDTSVHTSSPKSAHQLVGISIRSTEDCQRAEKNLLSGLVKATEGWMALHINRKISLAVTRRLMHTCVTPNHMTGVSMALGLVGAACFLSPEHGMQILGALFFLAHSILDGCDGELARLKFMESRLGGILDFWSDNMVHVSVFAAMGIGWAGASSDSFWPWLCALLAVGGTAISASLVYIHTMRTEKKTGPLYTSVSTSRQKSAVVRIADILSRRDFIYLVLILVLLNHTHWFLIMTAIGAPIYALLLINIMLRER